jgi:ABC-type lipoprotein release transport system permease subunit
MDIDLLLTLAKRNVWRNKRRTAVLLLTVSVSIWSMLMFGALVNGWSAQLRSESISDLTGHVKISAPRYLNEPTVTRSMAPPEESLDAYLRDSKKIAAHAVRVRVPAVVTSEYRSQGITLVGIDPITERNLSFISDVVTNGLPLSSPDDTGIVIGKDLAERLKTGLGKRLVILSQHRQGNITDRAFRIVGVYQASRPSLELNYIFTGLHTAQNFLGLKNDISELSIRLRDQEQLDNSIDSLRKIVPQLDVRSWIQLQPYATARLQMNDSILTIWYAVAFVAMCFGLINTLLMAVYERTKEIALSQALGMRPTVMLGQILIESIIFLLLGLLIGNMITAVNLVLLSGGIDLSKFASGVDVLGMSTTVFPIVHRADWISANTVVLIMGIVASLYPAWRSSKRIPVDAITRG